MFTQTHYNNDEYILNLNLPFDGEVEHLMADENEEDCVLEIEHSLNTLFEIIEPLSFISLLCPENSIELFFVAEVLKKGCACEDLMDSNGHIILKDDEYLEIHYLEKFKENKKYIQYKRCKQDTGYIHPAEVLSCFMQLDDEFKMDRPEYQSLTSAAL